MRTVRFSRAVHAADPRRRTARPFQSGAGDRDRPAKAVGKSTTAEQHVRGFLTLDSKATCEGVPADPQSLLRLGRPLLIDEWHKVPAEWDVVRRAVDDDLAGGPVPADRQRLTCSRFHRTFRCGQDRAVADAADDTVRTGNRSAHSQPGLPAVGTPTSTGRRVQPPFGGLRGPDRRLRFARPSRHLVTGAPLPTELLPAQCCGPRCSRPGSGRAPARSTSIA